jgi:flagellar hook-basal body complex protein FliE
MANPLAAADAYANIQSLTSGGGALKAALGQSGSAGAAKPDFGSLVTNALQSTVATGARADSQTIAAVQGKADLLDVVTAVAESEAAIETLVAVRDRVIAAYEEIMRMPV